MAQAAAVPPSKVRRALKIAQEPISIETPVGGEEESHLGDFLEDYRQISPADAVINLNLRAQTAQVLKSLSPREEQVIKMRFGLDDGSEHTLEEVGQSFAVTRERIRQIEAKALRKLRHPSRSRKLKVFVGHKLVGKVKLKGAKAGSVLVVLKPFAGPVSGKVRIVSTSKKTVRVEGLGVATSLS